MKIVETYSHLNGLEFLQVHQPNLWKEIKDVIAGVDAHSCRTKVSKEKRKAGKLLFSPIAMNLAMKIGFQAHQWEESRTSYWVTSDAKLIRKTMHMPPEQQKKEIVGAGFQPIASFNQTDFVKDRVAVEVQFGKYAFVAFDLFVKHMAFVTAQPADCAQKRD